MLDTTSLTEKITALRQLAQKDSISPETLGALLQDITDILEQAGDSSTLSSINSWIEKLKEVGSAIINIEQGYPDLNNVYAKIIKASFSDGAKTSDSNLLVLPATINRAGAMTAQQVSLLNSISENITTTQTQIKELNSKVAELSSSDVLSKNIYCEIDGCRLFVRGANSLIEKGYVPYIFRLTKKRNRYKKKWTTGNDLKGWHLLGSMYTAIADSDGLISISNANNSSKHGNVTVAGYKPFASNLVQLNEKKTAIGWGKSIISLYDSKTKKLRMLRLPFALAFGKANDSRVDVISPTDMVTNLARFSVIYCPKDNSWSFGK